MWRSRWAIWALFAALLVRIALPGVVAAAGGGDPVVVAARAVPAGTELAAADVRVTRVPGAALPQGALTSVEQAIGGRPKVDLPKGLTLTESLLGAGRSFEDLPGGLVAVAVRLSDPGLAGVLNPGDRIDLLASAGAAASGLIAPAQPLAESALVVEVGSEAGSDSGGGLAAGLGQIGAEAEPSGLLLVAVTPEEAALIGGASSWAVISAVLVPP
jgi:Flp pilus assembly protein CpaB